MFHLPRYIAFCGVPKCGKSLAQELLLANYNVQPVDDGEILRKFAMDNLGATRDQVYSQEGKASLAFWPNGDPMIDARTGQQMTWRIVLGFVGNQLEALFGKHVMPMTACARVAKQSGPFSFGSVRRDQGAYYQRHGGIIIEIVNPQAKPTGNEFDEYDASICDFRINNDALSRGYPVASAKKDLAEKLHQIMLDLTLRAREAA